MNYACRMAAPDRPSRRIHPAWVVLGSMTLCMAVASGLRAVFGVYVKPLEAEFGWSRGAISGVAALSLLILGAVGPFAGRLADRWGPRRVTLLAVGLLGVGAIGASAIHTLWQAYLTTGVLMGIGAGGLGLATGSVIAARWFETRRGLAIGLAAGGSNLRLTDPGAADAGLDVADAVAVEVDHDLEVLGVPAVHGRHPAEVKAPLGHRAASAVDQRPAPRRRHLLD